MFVLLLALLLPGCTSEEPPPVEGVDRDADGFAPPDDCDDNDALINPNADEVCDGADNDCDGNTDDAGAGSGAWYPDLDKDGYGDRENGVIACEQPAGMIGDGNDCNDNDATANPDTEEVCDGIDNDCDDLIDDGAVGVVNGFLDTDGDGWGDLDEMSRPECTVPDGYSALGGDCDETDPLINPGVPEIWYDGIDQDCDGLSDYDQDYDGADVLGTGDDCDDEDPDRYPDAVDWCHDDVDQDCSGTPAACK